MSKELSHLPYSHRVAQRLLTSRLRCFLTLGLTSLTAVLHAQISVGPNGSELFTFDTTPPAHQWSTAPIDGIGGNAGAIVTVAGLEADVQTRAASLFNTEVTPRSSVPPQVYSLAQRNTTLNALQTVAGGASYTPLMATLRNDTGASQSVLLLTYDLLTSNASGAIVHEEIHGHVVFYSLTGEPGSWQMIPEISTIGDPGPMSAFLQLGSWAPGALLYILWVDDNGSGPRSFSPGAMTEGAYLIDNPSFTTSVQPVPSLEIVREHDHVTIRWKPAVSGFVLQSAASLSALEWQNAAAEIVVEGGLMRATVPLEPGTTRFYRLLKVP
jgi:hypothetical protein